MPRIAVGGFQHETNSFAPSPADWPAFVQADGWPALTRGQDLFDACRGMNLPIAGAIAELAARRHALVPLSWCSAIPSAAVTDDAFERIAALLVHDLAEALDQGPLDGLYLDLHGAAVTDRFEDAEGELLTRIRAVVGPSVPIVASLDLHANVTARMVGTADMLAVYRTYPHVDMADTGARAAGHLDRIVRKSARWVAAWRQIPFLIPLTWGCTLAEPARSIHAMARELEGAADSRYSLSFVAGFPAADIADCGPSVIAYADHAEEAERLADRLVSAVTAREADFAGRLFDADAAVERAMALADRATRPIVLADTQDNPGGGGTADTVGLLAALVRHGAHGAVLALLNDPETAAAAHRAGPGGIFPARLGAKSGLPGHEPLVSRVRVDGLGDGDFVGTGPMWGGARMRLGPMACLHILEGAGDIRVIVGSRKLQAADQAIFHHVGVEPAAQKILALKSSVHFRADFEPIADTVLVVEAPGPVVADPARLPWRRLRPEVRTKPLGVPLRSERS